MFKYKKYADKSNGIWIYLSIEKIFVDRCFLNISLAQLDENIYWSCCDHLRNVIHYQKWHCPVNYATMLWMQLLYNKQIYLCIGLYYHYMFFYIMLQHPTCQANKWEVRQILWLWFVTGFVFILVLFLPWKI